MNRSLAVLTNPNVIPTAPAQTPAFLKAAPGSFFVTNGVQKLLAAIPPSLPCPLTTLLGLMCVDVIALGRKGLASNNAKKKKKKKFPSYSTCTYNEMICIILTRVYYCWGLPSSFEGYFVLPAAICWEPEVTTRRAHTYPTVVCRPCVGTRENTHHQNGSLWISSFTNFYINLKTHFSPHFFPQANCPPLLSPTCLSPRKAECSWPEAWGGTLSWVVLSLQATKTHLGGKVLFFPCLIVKITLLRDKLSF